MSLYNGTEFNRPLLQFKHSIPFILRNYFFYPPGNTTKITKSNDYLKCISKHKKLDSRHAKQGNKHRLETKLILHVNKAKDTKQNEDCY